VKGQTNTWATLSRRLRQGRKILGLTQAQAARKAKIDVRTWRRMEDGKPTRMKPLHSIVGALGLSYDWLMGSKKVKPFLAAVKDKDGSFLIRDADTGKLLGRYTDIEIIKAKLERESRR
jgi:transcriptional regulator with XRE-family HTH domain